MLEHMDKLAETSAEAISNIKFDKVVVWENGNGKNGSTNTADFLKGMARSLPPMMQVWKDVAGIELPESLLKFDSDDEPVELPTANGRLPHVAVDVDKEVEEDVGVSAN